jgi:hypothetical protein
MEKCCDSCAKWDYYCRSGFSASAVVRALAASTAVDGNRWDSRWLSGRGRAPTFFVFPVFNVAVMEMCCGFSGGGEYNLRNGSLALHGADI